MTVREIASRFFKIEKWFGQTAIGEGNINDTYRIDFQELGIRKAQLLQRLNHEVFRQPEAVMENWQAIAEHLRRSNFPLKIPLPAVSLDGKTLLKIEQPGEAKTPPGTQKPKAETHHYYRVFPFFENTFSPEKAATPEIAFEAAKAYGIFLKALNDFPARQLSETIPGFHDTDQRWVSFLEILKNDPAGRRKLAETEIEKMFAAQPIFLKISELKRSGQLPLRATHNDTKAGNVLLDQRTGKAVAVIDWDTVMPGTALSDFGDMMRSFAPDRPEADPDFEKMTLRLDVVEGMCRGFLGESAAVLSQTERENLTLGGQWIIGEQALRFLADFLAGDVYYKTAYPEQNLVRAKNQLKLLELVIGADPEIRKFLN